MRRHLAAAVLFAACAAIYQVAAIANGGTVPAPPSASAAPRAVTPEELAAQAYNSGLGHRDKGLKAEEKALAAKKPGDRDKELKKAREEYGKAFKDFKKAAEHKPDLPHAYNGMGYAYRKLGDYARALEMYDRALLLSPNFPDAIEYRGEAYLALNRIDDAKQAYLTLFASDRGQADMLMKAMKAWVAERQANPSGVDPAVVSALETWIKERATIASETQLMSPFVMAKRWW